MPDVATPVRQSERAQPKTQQTSAPPPANDWVAEADAYLKSKGWEKTGSNEFGIGIWEDPAGSRAKPEPTTIITLPGIGGTTETIKQMTAPPIPWSYNTMQAVQMQRQRDAAGNPEGGTPLERLHKLEQRFAKLDNAHGQLVSGVEKLLRLPTPNKPEGFVALKNLAAEALANARREYS